MIVVHVTLNAWQIAAPDRRRWVLFETEAESIDDMCARLNRGEIVSGFQLWTRPLEGGDREVVDTRERTFRDADVYSIQPLRWALVRSEDDKDTHSHV